MHSLRGHAEGGGGTLLLRLLTIWSHLPIGNPILHGSTGMTNLVSGHLHLCSHEEQSQTNSNNYGSLKRHWSRTDEGVPGCRFQRSRELTPRKRCRNTNPIRRSVAG